VRVVQHKVDNHRLALALEEAGELLPLVRAAVHHQLAAAGVTAGDAPESGGGGGGGSWGNKGEHVGVGSRARPL